MRIRDAIRGRIASAAVRVVLVAGGVLVGWLLFAAPAQAAPEEEGPGADSGGLLGLVPVPPVLAEPDPAVPATEVEESVEPVADLVEEVTEPVEQVTEPVERVTEPVERVTEPVEQVTESVERVTEPVEQVTESVERVTEPVEQVTESVAQVTEPVTRVVEPVTRVVEPVTGLVEQTTTTVVDPVTEILVDPVVPPVDPLLGAVEPVAAAVTPLVEAAPDPVGPIAEGVITDAGLPAVLPQVSPAEPVTVAGPLPTLSAATVDRTSMAGPPQPPVTAAAGPPPVWWPGSAPEQAHSPPTRAGPAPDPSQDRPLPGPVPGSGTYQLAGGPTDFGQPLAWTGPAMVEPSADPFRLPISGDVVGSGLALPISPPPG
jgi:archaellum component FlaC